MEEILWAFSGEIKPVKTTVAYRLGILLVTAGMVLLPLVYLCLIAGVMVVVYFHVTMNLDIHEKVRNVWVASLMIFGGPLFAGFLLILFMVKPFFSRQPRRAKLFTLEFGENPLLFGFVTRVAQAVGAPEPRRIEVDNQANASASFGSKLGVLFGGDLVLTLGLPLVAGMDTRELGMILAHELGHFGQGVGMRLSLLIRSINYWFVRVVYERDDWDEALEMWSAEDIRFAVFAYMARFCIWITRGLLWCFMVLGHGISCFLLRQREYNADLYGVRLAGTQVFAQTFRNLAVLDLASHLGDVVLSQCWQSQRFPDDHASLLLQLTKRIPADQIRLMDKELEKQDTGFFDSHPAFSDRITNVKGESAIGILHLNRPATSLFGDFNKLSRRATLTFYEQIFRTRFRKDSLVPVSAFFKDATIA